MTTWTTPEGERQSLWSDDLAPEGHNYGAPSAEELKADSDKLAEMMRQESTTPQQEVPVPAETVSHGILQSARDAGGGAIIARSIRATDQVTLPGGIPTSVSVAADLGFVRRNPDGSFSDAPPPTGMLASARDAGGGAIIARSIRATDQVMLPGGIPTSVSVAADLGYLVRNADGSFSELPTEEGNANVRSEDTPEHDEKTEQDPPEFTLSDEGRAVLTEIAKTVDPGAAIRAADELIIRGEVSESTLGRMASQAGVELHEMAEKVETAYAAFYWAGQDFLSARGVTNQDAFTAFLSDHPRMSENMNEAARDLIMTNDTAKLSDVADAFLERADRYMPEDMKASLEAIGYGHKSDGKGGLLVLTPEGMEIPFQVVIRQRILEFG